MTAPAPVTDRADWDRMMIMANLTAQRIDHLRAWIAAMRTDPDQAEQDTANQEIDALHQHDLDTAHHREIQDQLDYDAMDTDLDSDFDPNAGDDERELDG
ncbi:MAG TPA: hypothetical protein VJT31_02725 [Rugosimonospora sp.]|nr:hypothetical protein [Rugosimonospora sp.]